MSASPTSAIAVTAANSLGVFSGSTNYIPLEGFTSQGDQQQNSRVVRPSGTVRVQNLLVKVPTNTTTTSGCSFFTRMLTPFVSLGNQGKESSGNLQVVVGPGQTGTFEDVSHADFLPAGYGYQYGTIPSGLAGDLGTLNDVIVSCVMTNASGGQMHSVLQTTPPLINTPSTVYVPLAGAGSSATEAKAQVLIEYPTVFGPFGSYIVAPSASGSINLRVNGVTVVSIPFSNNASTVNSSATVAVAAGSLVCWQIVVSVVPSSVIIHTLYADVTDTGNLNHFTNVLANPTSPITVGGAGGTFYYAWVGDPHNGATSSESANQLKVRGPGAPYVVANAFVDVPTNTLTAGTSFVVANRKNGVDGSVQVVVAAKQTGTFEDVSHADIYAYGDLGNWRVTSSTDIGGGTVSVIANTLAPLPGGGIAAGRYGNGRYALPIAQRRQLRADVH